MDVHAATRDVIEWLRHERGNNARRLRHCLECVAERDHVVGSLERRGCADIDLVLSTGDLVVGRVDVDAHRLESRDHRLPETGTAIRGVVEVRAAIVCRRTQIARGVALEEEELNLRADVIIEAECRGGFDRPA